MAKLRNGVARTLSAYICTPDRKIVCRIKGITTFEVAGKGLNDFSTISFVVQKYTTNQATLQNELNESYAKLHAFCEIFIPEYDDRGAYFLINAEPEIIAQGERNEYKQFTAASYESVLQYENLVNFKINQGTEESVEMEPDNLDELGIPKKLIRLWDEDPKFSLIDLILRDDYYGWRPGKSTGLSRRWRGRSMCRRRTYIHSSAEMSRRHFGASSPSTRSAGLSIYIALRTLEQTQISICHCPIS